MSDAEKIINDFETLAPCRIIDSCNIRHHGILGSGVVFEKGDDRNNAGRGNIDCELILPDGELLYVFGHAREEILTVGMEAGRFLLVLVRRVHHRRVKLASSYGIRSVLRTRESRCCEHSRGR